jgi:hypothetical protein
MENGKWKMENGKCNLKLKTYQMIFGITYIMETMETTDRITNSSLRMRKYTVNELELWVNDLNMKVLVNTQKLTVAFCVKYVLNEDYAQCGEEVDLLTTDYVMYNQPHLSESDLLQAYHAT